MEILCVEIDKMPEWVRDFHDAGTQGFGATTSEDSISLVRKFEIDALDAVLYTDLEGIAEVFIIYDKETQ